MDIFHYLTCVLAYFFLITTQAVFSDKVKEKIYIEFGKMIPICFRRLNSVSEMGCGSSRYGNVGVIRYISTDRDWNSFTSGSDSNDKHEPYIAVLEPKYFTKDNIKLLIANTITNGVIVLNTPQSLAKLYTDETYRFSPDQSCPNDGYGISHADTSVDTDCSQSWNEDPSNGLLDLNIPFPIFLLNNASDAETLLDKCYFKFNHGKEGVEDSDWPLCAGELDSFMFAANSSVTCIRRNNIQTNLKPEHYCDPLKGGNVYGSHLPTSKNVDGRKYVVLATRIDSLGFFDSINPAVDSAVTGFITSLATAYIMGRVSRSKGWSDDERQKDLIFLFLHGESYDYIGSSKVIYDMSEDKFPMSLNDDSDQPHLIKIEDISLYLELNQLAGICTTPNCTTTKLNVFATDSANAAYNMLEAQTSKVSVNIDKTQISGRGESIPPLSAQRFYSARNDLPMLLLTGYKDRFNRFYNAHVDRLEGLNLNFTDKDEPFNHTEPDDVPLAKSLALVAEALALTLYKEVYDQDFTFDHQNDLIKEISEMLYCFGYTSKCKLFESVMSPSAATKWMAQSDFIPPFPTYITVRNNNNIPKVITPLLAYYLRLTDTSNTTEDECKGSSNVTHQWLSGRDGNGTCIVSSVWMTQALSPAFIIDDYDLASNPQSYSTWTESVWTSAALRVFLLPDPSYEIGILLAGLITLGVSLVTVYIGQKRWDLLAPQTSVVANTVTTAAVTT